MRTRVLLLCVIAVIALSAAPVFAQVCGDVDNGGTPNIGDLTRIIYYIATGNPSIDQWAADVDQRLGVTVGDAVTMSGWLFHFQPPQLICNATSAYSFTPSIVDTIFFPRAMNIPDGVDSVTLPVIVSLGTEAGGFFVPFLPPGTGGDELFSLNRIQSLQNNSNILYPGYRPDTSILLGSVAGDATDMAGRLVAYKLHYRRVGAGTANVVPEIASQYRQLIWRTSVERGGDLFVPVVSYYDIATLADTVRVSSSSLSYSVVAGADSSASQMLNFTTDFGPVSFDLTPSDPWIESNVALPVRVTAPTAVPIKIGASALAAGNYNGYLTISNVDPPQAWLVSTQIDISVAAAVPITFYPGDLNCDGGVNIGDLSRMIAYLKGQLPKPQPCHQ